MHDDLQHLSLTFPDIPVGMGTPRDLKRFLYKGGADYPIRELDDAIKKGQLGDILFERVALVRSIHDFITGELAGGGSAITARSLICSLKGLFAWADNREVTLSTATALQTSLQYCGHLRQKFKVEKSIKQDTAYQYAADIGMLLDAVLEREAPMIRLSRIARPKRGKRPQGAAADKQNLQETFAFGHLLQDICDATPLDVIQNTALPLRIPRRGGGEVVFTGRGTRRKPLQKRPASDLRKSAELRLAYLADRSLDHANRAALVNLRIATEMMMWLAQTGKNLTQAVALPLLRVTYASDTEGYRVLDYKNRAGGEVMFNIYGEYRHHFDRYLEWRRSLFPESEQRLFPFIRKEGALETAEPPFSALKRLCKQVSVRCVSPRKLRGTRVNWCLRRSGDPELAADMAQHTVEVLREN